MQEIRYSRTRLWVGAIAFAHATFFMFILFLNPHYLVRGPFSFFFNGSLGHFITLPLMTLACIILTIRCLIVAVGPAIAIVTDTEGATVNTIWRSYRIVWSELLRVRVEAKKLRRTTLYSLKFDRCAGGTISMPLAGLNLPKQRHEYERLAQTLSETHLAAINRCAVASTKAATSTAHDVVPPSSTPLRPLFGRKNT